MVDIFFASMQFENTQKIYELQKLMLLKEKLTLEMEHQNTSNQKRDIIFKKIQEAEEKYQEAHEEFCQRRM